MTGWVCDDEVSYLRQVKADQIGKKRTVSSRSRIAALANGAYDISRRQPAHAQRRVTGHTPWGGIAQLYALLVAHQPSLGARVGQAVAQAEAGDALAGLATLDALLTAAVQAYGPYWVARAHVLQLAGAPGRSANPRQNPRQISGET